MSDEGKPHIEIYKWDELQHYKDRDPPWIKLYNRLLDHYDYSRLPDAAKGQYVGLLMLASRHEGKIPLDVDWIAHQINATEPLDLRPLVNAGLIEVYHADSKRLSQDASRSQAFARSREAEGETEAEESAEVSLPTVEKPSGPRPDVDNSQEASWNERIADTLREHAYPNDEPEGSWTVGQDLSIAKQLLDEGYTVPHVEDAIEGLRMMVENRHPTVRDWIEPGQQFTLRVLNRQAEMGEKIVQVAPSYLYKHAPVSEAAEAVAG